MFFDKIPVTTKKSIVYNLKDFSKGLDKTIVENLLPPYKSVDTFNFNYVKKGLVDGLGVKPLVIYNGDSTKTMQTPSDVGSVLGFWVYNKFDGHRYVPQLMIYGSNESIYTGTVPTLNPEFYKTSITFSRVPVCYNYKINNQNCFLACSTDKIVVFNEAQNQTYTQNVPSIVSVAFYKDRLFALLENNDNKVFFSSTLNPTSWNMTSFDGETLELNDGRGPCRKLIEAGDYLYVIRDYGISRITYSERDDSFSVNHVFKTMGKIYANSTVLCGNEIYFLCRDGLYCFSSGKVKKLVLGIEEYLNKVENNASIGAFLFGKLYLALKLKFNDGLTIGCESSNYVNNALLEYDFHTNQVNLLRGVDASAMCEYQSEWASKLVVCLRNGNICELTTDGKVNSASTLKMWKSGFTDFGYAKLHKVIKRINLNTKQDIVFSINADGIEKDLVIHGDSLPISVPVNLRARKFSFTILSENADNEISNVEFEIDLC